MDKKYNKEKSFTKDSKFSNNEGFRRNNSSNFRFFKKKFCRFCDTGKYPDFKEFDLLRRSITEQGKILPRRIIGSCAKHQRGLAKEIKKARYMALLPFVKG